MKQPTREDLLGYMLGALDATEAQQIEQLIEDNPDIQSELDEMESMMAPLQHLDTDVASSPGLARRTVEYVAGNTRSQVLNAKPVLSPAPEPPGMGRGWSVTDFIVGALAIVILAAVAIPTINYARFNSRVTLCQNNLREVGNALFAYQENSPTHSFISIPVCPDDPMNVAGCYAPILLDRELIDDQRKFFCSGADERDLHYIPTCDEIQVAQGPQLAQYRKNMGGDFGYSLGYYDQGRYCSPRNRRRCNFAVLADKPSVSRPGRQSNNHGGKGQNVWFEDGHIEFLTVPVTRCGDAIYENNSGDCGPGNCCSDACIGASYASPVKPRCPSESAEFQLAE